MNFFFKFTVLKVFKLDIISIISIFHSLFVWNAVIKTIQLKNKPPSIQTILREGCLKNIRISQRKAIKPRISEYRLPFLLRTAKRWYVDVSEQVLHLPSIDYKYFVQDINFPVIVLQFLENIYRHLQSRVYNLQYIIYTLSLITV